jgi:2-polyprenyl-3-methyl-5-hydroxy-6-metoxy-1,4-benzoquinol methylase
MQRVPELCDEEFSDIYRQRILNAEEEEHEILTGYLDFLKERQSLRGRGLLDAGCNASRFPHDIACRYPELVVVGIDKHAASIATASEKYHAPNLHYLQADIADCATVNSKLDIITTVRSLHEFPNLEESLRYLRQGLRRNGMLYFMDLNREKAPEVLEELAAPTLHDLLLHKEPEHICKKVVLHLARKSPEHGAAIIRLSSFLAAYTPQEMEDTLHRTGYGEIEIHRTSDNGMFVGAAWATKTI